MKKTFQSVLAVFIAFGLTANAQTKPAENSLLWEISGNGLSNPSYLYGTMHLMCEKDFAISSQANRTFEQAQKLVLELDMDDAAELESMQKTVMSDVPLSKSLTPAEYQKLDAFLQKSIGVGVAPFENYTLLSILSVVIIKSLNCSPKAFELEFTQMAAKRDMEVLGFEKIAEQVAIFDHSYTNAELIEQLQYYDSAYLRQMTEVYVAQDLNKLYEMIAADRFMDDNARKSMLDSRNENWVKQMPATMQKQSTFFAVGAAHLPGDKGLLSLLARAGYTVKPVTK
jgi:uncharacterized protein YbaP (TraB family)